MIGNVSLGFDFYWLLPLKTCAFNNIHEHQLNHYQHFFKVMQYQIIVIYFFSSKIHVKQLLSNTTLTKNTSNVIFFW